MWKRIKCLFGYHDFTILEKKYFHPQEMSNADRYQIINREGYNVYFLIKSGFTEIIHICRNCKKYNTEHYVGE